ncbi:META domain-containing protein [Phaeocystidibacter marisrubri]|nr:META domain-containing protein [Phaeocystidibacter marisrubri]
MNLKRVVLPVVAMSALMFSCSSSPKLDTPVHSEWKVSHIEGFSNDIPAENTPTLRMVMTHASGSSACNQYTGTFSLSGNELVFNDMVSTRKMCTPELMEVEVAYLDALRSVKKWEIIDQQLHLKNNDNSTLLTFAFSQPINEEEEY